MEIQSLQNAKVKDWLKLHQKKYRDREKQFLVEGEHLIVEALHAGCLKTLLIREGAKNIFSFHEDVYVVTSAIMDKLSQNVSPVDYIGICKQHHAQLKQPQRLIFLDGIQDPGNMGTIIRSAYSFGYDAVILSEDCVDVYNDKTIRSTQGALFHIATRRENLALAIKTAKADGVQIVATALEKAVPLRTMVPPKSFGLVLGNEGKGIREAILELADNIVKIEMDHFESLNVGVAASICMYYLKGEDI